MYCTAHLHVINSQWNQALSPRSPCFISQPLRSGCRQNSTPPVSVPRPSSLFSTCEGSMSATQVQLVTAVNSGKRRQGRQQQQVAAGGGRQLPRLDPLRVPNAPERCYRSVLGRRRSSRGLQRCKQQGSEEACRRVAKGAQHRFKGDQEAAERARWRYAADWAAERRALPCCEGWEGWQAVRQSRGTKTR